MIVQPATVLRWRRQGLRSIWTSGSRGRWRGGRPRIDGEIRALVVRMSRANFLWGAPRIHGELLKLGFDVSQATVSRYMPRRSYPPSQSWCTFLRNQALGIGTIGLGEPGRIPNHLLTLVRGWIERIARCTTKLRDSISNKPASPTLPSLRPSCSSNGLIGGPSTIFPRRIAHGEEHWTMGGRRPSPYRSRASPRGSRRLYVLRQIIWLSPLRRANSPILGRKLQPRVRGCLHVQGLTAAPSQIRVVENYLVPA
jgi:hypothetical protein